MYLQLRRTDTMPRDGGGTENIQKSANEAAVKKNIQTSAKTFFQFFVYSHSLTWILTHFCILCEASDV